MTRRISSDLRRWATSLFDQQLWCWGRDIERPEGNVLLDLGMSRYRSPEPGCSTLYKAVLAGDAEVWLWGFGLLYRDPGVGCVFLRRYGFDPLLVARPLEHPVHRPEDIVPLVRPTGPGWTAAERLVQDAAHWIAGYEHWIAENLGIEYRRSVLNARDKPPIVPADEMAASWERLARKSFRLSVTHHVADPWARLLASLRLSCDVLFSSSNTRCSGSRHSFHHRGRHHSSGGR